MEALGCRKSKAGAAAMDRRDGGRRGCHHGPAPRMEEGVRRVTERRQVRGCWGRAAAMVRPGERCGLAVGGDEKGAGRRARLRPCWPGERCGLALVVT